MQKDDLTKKSKSQKQSRQDNQINQTPLHSLNNKDQKKMDHPPSFREKGNLHQRQSSLKRRSEESLSIADGNQLPAIHRSTSTDRVNVNNLAYFREPDSKMDHQLSWTDELTKEGASSEIKIREVVARAF